MQTQRTFTDNLRHQYKHGGMHIRLIFINVIVFLAIAITMIFAELSHNVYSTGLFLSDVFALHTKPIELLKHPWGLFTSIFAHFDLIHILFNMIFLYFAGKIFEQLFSAKRLLYTYIVGGIAGGLLEFIAHLMFPSLGESTVIGASGSIMAIFVAVAFYRPNLTVRPFGMFSVKIIWIAAAYILFDVLSLAADDGTAHFAHIGGAIIGIISIQNIQSKGNIINVAQAVFEALGGIFRKSKRPKFTVVRGDKAREMTDEEYNVNAKARQAETDRILEKISKSGYESLNKREKDFLFNQSKNG